MLSFMHIVFLGQLEILNSFAVVLFLSAMLYLLTYPASAVKNKNLTLAIMKQRF